jgi:hypothetical protein
MQAVPPTPHAQGALPLSVALSPQRGHAVISFAERVPAAHGGERPALAVFAHVEGSRVYEGLFPKFALPGGGAAFFYLSAGSLQARCAAPQRWLLRAPARASSCQVVLTAPSATANVKCASGNLSRRQAVLC